MRQSRLAIVFIFVAANPSCGVSVDHGSETQLQSTAEHAVLIHLKLRERNADSTEVLRGQELEVRLDESVRHAGVGLLDGNEIGEVEYVIFIYGSDASKLLATVKPVLSPAAWPGGGYIQARSGPPGAREERVVFPYSQ
jgi:hypothetical protein